MLEWRGVLFYLERSPDKVTRPEDLRELSCEYIGMSIPRWPKDKSKPIAKRLERN